MFEMPAAVDAYFKQLSDEQRIPAYLQVDLQGNLTAWGGNIEAYGMTGLRAGEPVGDQVFFLEGLLPLDHELLVLSCMQTDSGRPADLHLFHTNESDFALFLDASAQELQQRLMQQKGNELSLNYQRLVKEIQQKEVLLHCIVHDLAGPLMGIKGGYELLSKENISEGGRKFLELGLRQANKQEMLIREILQAFSAEVDSLNSVEVDPEKAPDALSAAQEVIEALSPAFALNQVKLRLSPDLDQNADWKIVGEKSRLERVISNLVENALRHSPANSSVTISLNDEDDNILVAIDDQGPGVPADIAPTLFQKFSQGKKGRGKIGLGLYFCRITVEHWGGQIGHSPGKDGGARFWFRLPRPTAKKDVTG